MAFFYRVPPSILLGFAKYPTFLSCLVFIPHTILPIISSSIHFPHTSLEEHSSSRFCAEYKLHFQKTWATARWGNRNHFFCLTTFTLLCTIQTYTFLFISTTTTTTTTTFRSTLCIRGKKHPSFLISRAGGFVVVCSFFLLYIALGRVLFCERMRACVYARASLGVYRYCDSF